MRLQGVYVCIWVGGNYGESLQEHAHQRKKKIGGRGGGGGAAPLWMISVSRAAGYGKFTQTNDSHLPEARDTIVGGGWCLGVGGGVQRRSERRPKMLQPRFQISPSAWGELFALLTSVMFSQELLGYRGDQEPWTPLELQNQNQNYFIVIVMFKAQRNLVLANNRKKCIEKSSIYQPYPTSHILTPPPPVVSNHAQRSNLLHYDAWHQSLVWLETILWKYLHSAGWKLILSMTLCLLITWG